MTEPGNLPRKRPSSRAIMPSAVSPSLVTHTILVSAFVYWAGSRTKSNASCGVTPRATAVPSPRIIANESSSVSRFAVQLRHRDEARVGETGGAILRHLLVLRARRHVDERLARRVLDEDHCVPLVCVPTDHDGVGPPLPQDPGAGLLEHRAHAVAVARVRVAPRLRVAPVAAVSGRALRELEEVEHHDRRLEVAVEERLDLLLGRSDRHLLPFLPTPGVRRAASARAPPAGCRRGRRPAPIARSGTRGRPTSCGTGAGRRRPGTARLRCRRRRRSYAVHRPPTRGAARSARAG